MLLWQGNHIKIVWAKKNCVPLRGGNFPDIDRTSSAIKYHVHMSQTYSYSFISSTLKLPVLCLLQVIELKQLVLKGFQVPVNFLFVSGFVEQDSRFSRMVLIEQVAGCGQECGADPE